MLINLPRVKQQQNENRHKEQISSYPEAKSIVRKKCIFFQRNDYKNRLTQKQQQQEQNQDQQQQQQEQQQQSEDQMDKETAEQILQALEQDEQDTQEKMQRQQGKKRRVEKEW